MSDNNNIRPLVFWPPFLLLLIAVAMSLYDLDGFLKTTSAINDWILDRFAWLFSFGTLSMVAVCVWVCFSPLARVRIGGAEARPMLSKWRWFSITLCTTVAIGILFWATAEPMYHLYSPPESLHLTPNSPEAAKFALSTLYLHWSFTPYAIYAVPALMFALAHYNLGKPFSLASAFTPLVGDRLQGKKGQLLDALALFALVAGMAASLGTGVMTLSGGLNSLLGIPSNTLTQGLITLAIVCTFILSAASGLQKGIAVLSNLNTKLFFAACLFLFLFGPTTYILGFGMESLGEYVTQFFQKSLFTGAISGDPWPRWWTIFYWANWLAWAPVTALFLGKIARGYTVREFMVVNLILPASFAIVWMAIFGGTALHMDMHNNGLLHNALEKLGPESVIYTVLNQLPLAGLTSLVFVFVAFLSYVTAADSNTEAMSNLCSQNGSQRMEHDEQEASSGNLKMKLVWGGTIGFVAWVMTGFAGIDGIKMMSNLGGLPALFIILGITASLVKVLLSADLLGMADNRARKPMATPNANKPAEAVAAQSR
ncbi:BCCT transporter [Pokkaliibacter plantistimulans]|uniref:BCCT transporter n=1 Tax=Proteobacteria bacterium 228 TaxID=2083153 RepID=A0A2S5KHZ8_9PROT|nr:BCCT family transporter [Pokkaliibacter plantistimulans]PPC73996.1 BCCT transporter [Pokkaliibacter plantistimulans]